MKAYLEPAVDLSDEPFAWQKPNIEGLKAYVNGYHNDVYVDRSF